MLKYNLELASIKKTQPIADLKSSLVKIDGPLAADNAERAALDHDDITDKIQNLTGQKEKSLMLLAGFESTAAPLKTRLAKMQSLSDPVCPTCEQTISPEFHAAQINTLKTEIENLRNSYRDTQSTSKTLAAEISALQANITRIAVLNKSITAAMQKQSDLLLAIDRSEHLQSRKVELSASAEAAQKQITRLETERLEIQTANKGAMEIIADADIVKQNIAMLRASLAETDKQIGAAEQQITACQTAAAECKILESKLGEIKDKESDYALLRSAFGKNGIPAMIIETVIPEIEIAANQLLGRMTDGRMSVRIETTKENKSGEIRDSLEIIICDELGDRPYEMYSGGEAFRVNFALRIALSKILAHRSGAPLRCLFIDEGFGSQDEAGRDSLVSAINSIKNEFDRILVITHIAELKDAFPVQIGIVKTPAGSVFIME